MELHNLKYTKGSRDQKNKRVGRGHGSGMGKTSTRGQDGQKSRKSGHTRLGFEGGQTPLYRRVPKIGFNNINFANQYNVVNLKDIIEKELIDINFETLKNVGLISNKKLPIKIIGNMKLTKQLNVKVNKLSKGAELALKDSKSKIEII